MYIMNRKWKLSLESDEMKSCSLTIVHSSYGRQVVVVVDRLSRHLSRVRRIALFGRR